MVLVADCQVTSRSNRIAPAACRQTPQSELPPPEILGQTDAGALADQMFAHPMESLQVELFGGLSRHKLHRGALDRLRVVEVFF